MKFEKNKLFKALSNGDISPLNKAEIACRLLKSYSITEKKEVDRLASLLNSLNLPKRIAGLKFIYFSQDMANRVTSTFAKKVLTLIKDNWIKIKTGIVIVNDQISAYFFNNGREISIALHVSDHVEDVVKISRSLERDELIGMSIIIEEKDGSASAYSFPIYILCLLFLRDYAEHEVKYVHSGHKKEKIGIKREKVFNSSPVKVECIDSNWFTTIIRSDGFSVKGHFRMQPYGEKLKYRKLIWINDFEKTGYTKKAKMLNTQI